MALRFGVLPQVLYQPKQAFEKIKAGTTAADGIIMALILTIVAEAISRLPDFAGKGANVASALTFTAGMSLIGVVGLLLLGAISALIAGGKKDMGKTVGLLGYGFVLSVPQSLVAAALAALGIPLINTLGGGAGALSMVAVVSWIAPIAIAFLIWAIWVYGSAVAAANGVTLRRGIIAYFVASIIAAFVVGIFLVSALYSAFPAPFGFISAVFTP